MDIIVSVVSLGCAKNLVDTEVMCGSLVANGCYLSASESDANVILVNTCCFIQDARDEAEHAIRDAIAWKRRSRRSRRMVVVAGCLVQRDPQDTARRFPEVDLFLGLDDIPDAAGKIKELFAKPDSKQPIPVGGFPTYLYDHHTPRLTVTPEAFAYVKIAEGCDHRCGFCAIPLFRGHQRSRQDESIVEECKQLLNQGVREINFIAQDSSSYAKDRKNGDNLAKLLRKCDEIQGDFWLRVLYTHPLHTSDELLETIANGKHIVPYLDMPIQHCATPVLKAMKRGFTGPQTQNLLNHIRQDFPNLTIRTTVLLGYPGETEEDFNELLKFICEFKFDRLGAFAFSPEIGTYAASIKDNLVPTDVANYRKDLILRAQAEISRENNAKLLGKKLNVLLETQLEGPYWEARTKADAPDVDQIVTVKVRQPKNTKPRFTDVIITETQDFEMNAEECQKIKP